MIKKTVPYKPQSQSRIHILMDCNQMSEQNDSFAVIVSADNVVLIQEEELDLAYVAIAVVDQSENLSIKLNRK